DCRPGHPAEFCTLDAWFGGVSYSQVLSPVSIGQVSVESAYLDGFQGNLFRIVPSSIKYDFLPERRLRGAITPRFAYYIPSTDTGFQLHYRLYFDFYPGDSGTPSDPWELSSHTIEARVYPQVTPTLQVRFAFRYYRQSHAAFWCAPPNRPTTLPATDFCAMATNPPSGYLNTAVYYTSDPKLGPVVTEYTEIALVWAADALRAVPFMRWFAAGTFEISYGHYFQNTSFGNAHVLQTGYRLAF